MKKALLFIFIVMLIIGNASALTFSDLFSTQAAAPASSKCILSTVKLQPRLYDIDNPGVTLNSAGINYDIVLSGYGATKANKFAMVPSNKQIAIIGCSGSNSYYPSAVKSINTGCSSTVNAPGIGCFKPDTSLNSFYFANPDGSVNGQSNRIKFGKKEAFEVELTIKAGSGTNFGSPTSACRNVAVIEYDKTFISMVKTNTPTVVPGAFTYDNKLMDGANAFFIPKSNNGRNEKIKFIVNTQSSSVSGVTDIKVTLYDCADKLDTKTLKVISGVEDRDLNLIGLAKQSQKLYLYSDPSKKVSVSRAAKVEGPIAQFINRLFGLK